jgi:exopolysaccharide biosynthesis polyprenyl glycosylphosphotransferase
MTRSARLKKRLVRLLGDVAVAALALFAAFAIRVFWILPFVSGQLPAERLSLFSGALPWVLLEQVLSLALLGLYETGPPLGRVELVRRLFWAVGTQVLFGAAASFLGNLFFPRSVLVFYAGLDALLLFVFRHLLERFDPLPRQKVVLVGSGEAAQSVAREVRLQGYHGLEIAGYVTVPDPAFSPQADPDLGPCLGTLEDLPQLLRSGRAQHVLLVSSQPNWLTTAVDLLTAERPPATQVWLLPGPFESLIGRMRYRWVSDLPVIEVLGERDWRKRYPGKRLFDLTVGATLLLLSLPLLALAAVLVKVTSPGPVIYRQRRVGLELEEFEIWKLRTMYEGSEPDGEEPLAVAGDPRMTPVGAWLRRYRIDELPQLLQVLAGRMSLVGPRPERPGRVAALLKQVPGYHERFLVPPGITGLAQVHGEYHSSAENKLRYDLAYLASWSPWLDLAILWRTARVVLTSRGV